MCEMGRYKVQLRIKNWTFPFQMVLDSLSSVEVNFICDLLNITLHYITVYYITIHELQNEQVTPTPTVERPKLLM